MDENVRPHTPSNLCERISGRLIIETPISNEILYHKKPGQGMQNTGITHLTFIKCNNFKTMSRYLKAELKYLKINDEILFDFGKIIV